MSYNVFTLLQRCKDGKKLNISYSSREWARVFIYPKDGGLAVELKDINDGHVIRVLSADSLLLEHVREPYPWDDAYET